MERDSSPLPELPDDLKKKQEEINTIHKYIPTPPKSGNLVKTAARRVNRNSLQCLKTQSYDQSVEDIIDLGLSDPADILHVVRNHPNVGFFYMKTVAPRSSINFNPYNVKYVSFYCIIFMFIHCILYSAKVSCQIFTCYYCFNF